MATIVITTASGSKYYAQLEDDGRLLVTKEGWEKPQRAVAVFEDRLPAMLNTKKWVYEGGVLMGFNAQGTRTCRLIPGQVKPGMVLWSPRGLQSTAIEQVAVYGK